MKEGDDPDTKVYSVFLVTNRHVLAEKEVAFFLFNPEAGEPGRPYRLDLFKPDGTRWWVPHPDPDVDIAVGTIQPQRLADDHVTFAYFRSDQHGFTRAAAGEAGLSEGDAAYVLGFTMGLVGERSYALVRGATLSRVRDWLIGSEKSFLIDATIFPGNSGGPVVLRPELVAIDGTKPITRAMLLGIVHSYVPYRDVAIIAQTHQPRVIFEENSGLAMVHSVDQIEEAIGVMPVVATPEEQAVPTADADEPGEISASK